jgi:mRNA interferase MazF
MARGIGRGEIWTYEFRHPDKRRPVVVLSRPEAIDVMHTVMVAPITSTIRGLPREVPVGLAEGLKHASVVNLDHVQTIEKAKLSRFIGQLGPSKLDAMCRALAIATGCADG